jgi:hypothetical protein
MPDGSFGFGMRIGIKALVIALPKPLVTGNLGKEVVAFLRVG